MLGGLARWLRAAGYDASWRAGVEDWDLVRQAIREKSVLLTSDTGIFRIGIVRDASLFGRCGCIRTQKRQGYACGSGLEKVSTAGK